MRRNYIALTRNYIALTRALAAIGPSGTPPPPSLNLVGDFGGGSMFLLTGILAALLERERSGQGQVVDAAIVDGVSSMMAMFAGLVPAGWCRSTASATCWGEPRRPSRAPQNALLYRRQGGY